MRIDIVTLFPELCDGFLSASILGRARAKNLFEAHCHQIRDYTKNKQKQTDDYPYGGGCGMVLYAQPIADCLRAVQDQCAAQGRTKPHVVFLTAAGQQYNEETAKRLASYDSLALVCGHYEGIDERVIEALAGAPFDVRFLSFDDIERDAHVLDGVDVLINVGDGDTAHTGGAVWEDAEISSAIKSFVWNGGGFIGVGEPSGHQYQGKQSCPNFSHVDAPFRWRLLLKTSGNLERYVTQWPLP